MKTMILFVILMAGCVSTRNQNDNPSEKSAYKYYRIKQVDRDGKTTYSKVIMVK